MKQALLVIDAQQELMDGNQEEQSVWKKDSVLENINLVIKKAQGSDSIIVFIRDLDVSEGKGEGFQVHQAIQVPADSEVFDKKGTNSFFETPLLGFLKDNGIEHLVVMGCKTEHCIDTAVRTATVNGFDVTLVGDGHSTTDSETLSADKIISHHNEVLHGHDNVYHFSMVRTAQEDLFQPMHDQYR